MALGMRWEEATDRINDDSGEEAEKQAEQLIAFLEERGVEWKIFGWEAGSLWYALSVKESEIDFGCQSPQIVSPEHFQNRPLDVWVTRLLECVKHLGLAHDNLVPGWYIGSSNS